MSFTYRQLQGALPLLALWGLVSVMCALAGPFGTIDGMSLVPRFAYWALVVGVSILGSVLISRIAVDHVAGKLALWALYSVAIAGTVVGLNTLFFGGQVRAGPFSYLLGIVAVTVGVVHGMLWLAQRALAPAAGGDAAPDAPDLAETFQRRLPVAVRGPLVRIEAQDHYLQVVTQNGSDLILMRMADAVAELGQGAGVQVHRSHWVAVDAVRAAQRKNGRDFLEMQDGASVPVSRGCRPAAKAAGLI